LEDDRAGRVNVAFEGCPGFDRRDAILNFQVRFGCAPGIDDIRRGGNRAIEFLDRDRAAGA
jgi:hypothetical protein